MSNQSTLTVTMADAYQLVIDVLKSRHVPMLVSSPGIGKSALAKYIADKHNLYLVDIRLSQCDPADLNGFPWLDPETGKASYRPMDIFPVEGDPVPEGYQGWLILLDELNSAPKAVEAASYKILLDRMVGMYKLDKRCMVMGAGNLKTDRAIVNTSGTAQQSRMIWLEIRASQPAWMEWADANGVDHRVKSYLDFKPDMLHVFDPTHTDRTFPCPRTWEFMSDIIKPWEHVTKDKKPLLAGIVGVGASREFFSFCQIYKDIPSIEAIVKDPVNVPFGTEPSMHYALAGMVSANMNANNAEQLLKFLHRLTPDFQVSAVRGAIARDRSIIKCEAFKAWYTKNSRELVYNT